MNRVKLLGYEIDKYSFEDVINTSLELIKQDKVSQVVTINPEMIDCASVDTEFSEIIKNAEIVIPDGIGIELGLRLIGENIKHIAGIDYARKMLEISAQNNILTALIGAKPEVIQKAKKNLENEIPNLTIVYTQDGYFEDEEHVLSELKNCAPRFILVALGSPKQEKFISNAKKILPYGLMVGVGGSFDVWSGDIKRAPHIYQKLGLEWLYRTIKQPERFKRIFPVLPLFMLKVLKSKMSKEK